MGPATNRSCLIPAFYDRRIFRCQPGLNVIRTLECPSKYDPVSDVCHLTRATMPTDCLFREDSYLKECSATVLGLTEAGGILLDRTVFYAASGGQPADHGVLTTATGDAILIDNVTFADAGKTEIVHLPAATTGLSPKIGEPVHV